MRTKVIAWHSGLRVVLPVAAVTVFLCTLPLFLCNQFAQGDGPNEPLPDPLPLRRVLLSADRLLPELERVKRGQLVRLAREEFEQRVKQASLAGEALKHPPRLIESRYRASFVDSALQGSAEWKIVNPGAGPGLLAVEPLNIALRQARWPDNREAILGDLDGDGPRDLELLVEQPGERSLFLEWSARSTPVPGGLRFSLDLPACAVATLDLELPENHELTGSRDLYLITGPNPAAGNRRNWRVSFSGRSQVNLVVQFSKAGLPAPLVVSRQQTRQEVSPGQVQADYEFDLEVLHGGVKELRCECDAVLRPLEVNIRNLESWELRPGGKNKPGTLVIRLREPFQAGKLQVRCLAPLSGDKPWVSPNLRLANAVFRGETLILRIHPEIQLEDWRPAGFRLTESVFADGWHELSLRAGLDAGPNAERPSARLQPPRSEVKVQQISWWQITPQGMPLTVQFAYEVSRGRLFRLLNQLPAGWTVDQVELAPAGLLRHWTVAFEKGKPILLVDLNRPIGPGITAVLTVQARPSKAPMVPRGGIGLPLPDLVPMDASYRYGSLGISVAAIYQPGMTASVAATSADSAADAETGESKVRPGPATHARPPWAKKPPDFYFPFRGQGIDGTLQLRPRTTRLRARCSSDVVLASGRAAGLVRLDLHPDIGTPDHANLFIFGPTPIPWEWKTVRGGNRVQSMERLTVRENASRLAALAARHPLQAIALAAMRPPRGSWWRLNLARPLTEPLTLEANLQLPASGPPVNVAVGLLPLASLNPLVEAALVSARPPIPESAPTENRWEVPVVTVPAAERLDGQVILHLTGADLVRVAASGFQEGRGITDAERPDNRRLAPLPTSSWRIFRYAQLPLKLQLTGRSAAVDRSAEAVIDRAQLTTYLEPSGRLFHHYRFRLWNWRQQAVPVVLPPKARVLAARTDGHWLERLVPGRAENGCPRVDLPVVTERALHYFELVFATESPTWSLWSRLEAPPPSPPVPPVSLERSWCLPRDVVPANTERYQRLPAAAAKPEAIFSLPFGSSDPGDGFLQQEQQVADALTRLRKQFKPGESVSLHRLLETLVLDPNKTAATLVVDTWALREEGFLPSAAGRISPGPSGSVSGALPWGSLDLVCMPCRPAPVLTTRRQRSMWGDSASPYENEVAQAVVLGHDVSGRFRTVADWFGAAGGEPGAIPPTPPIRSLAELPAGTTSWRPLAGQVNSEQLVVVRPRALPLIGMGVAALLGLTAFFLVKRLTERAVRRLLLLWLASGGLALLWLPAPLQPLAWWPELAGAAAVMLWCLFVALGRVPAPRNGSPSTVIAGTIALGCLVAFSSQAAAPEPATVYLVPEADGKKHSVLAPVALLDQLQTLALRGVPGLRGAILLGASYEGHVDAGNAHFEAHFPVHCFGDGPVTLTLPLGGIQITEALLDGAPAHPVVLRAPREGYTMEVKGRGSHNVVLRFVVAVTQNNEDRELRFTIPELPRSRLTLEAPARSGYLNAPDARGSQRGSEATAARLEADLGAIGTVRVRWRGDSGQPRPATVSVREAYYWDLQASSARLLGILHYVVSKGWTSHFSLDLPATIEVVSVEAGSVPGGPPAPRLKEWRSKKEGPARRLLLEFQEPVSGELQVTLELVPREPFGAFASLVFPTPLEAQQGRGFLAYHVTGLEARVDQYHAITGIENKLMADTFAGSFGKPWRAARQEELPVPTHAYWRGRDGNLRLALEAPRSQLRCRQEVTWRIKPRQASFQATAQLAAPDKNLTLIEWDVPPSVVVTEVAGLHVRRWTRTAGRVQVWLQKPVADTMLQMTGWLPRNVKDSQRFDVPVLRFGARPQSTTIRILAGGGVTLAPEPARNLTLQTEQSTSGREWVYTTEAINYGLRVRTNPAASGQFRLLTFAEIRNRQLTFVSSIKCKMPRGEPCSLNVALRNWEGNEVVLDAPNVVRRREHRLDGGGRTWMLDLKPNARDEYQLTLTGAMSSAGATDVLLPDVRIEAPGLGSVAQQRWVGIVGSELTGEDVSGLQSVADLSDLQGWQGERERLRRAGGQIWQVMSDDWRLRLRPRSLTMQTAPVEVLLTEHALAVADGNRWLHQVTYRLYHQAGADLQVALPNGAVVLAVSIDEETVPPLQPGSERLWIPLPGGAGHRTIRISWTLEGRTERIETPSLECPRLDGVPDGPTVWTLHVPPGYDVGREQFAKAAGNVLRSDATSVDLRRAECQLRLLRRLRELGGDSADRSRPIQEQFEHLTRRIEYQLNRPGSAVAPGPKGQSPADWLRELREEYRQLVPTNRNRPEPQRTTIAAGQPLVLESFELGRPAYWQAPAGDAVPRVLLVPHAAEQTRQTLAFSTLLVVLVLAIWILARFFKAGSWPEQLIVLGILGGLLFGPIVGRLFLVLPLVGVAARLARIGAQVRSLWLNRKDGAAPAPTGP